MQQNKPSISVLEAIGTPNAILHSFGMTVYDSAKAVVQENKPIIIDFNGVRNLTSAFLHASVGNLITLNPASSNLITITGLTNPQWQEKVQDAIALALDPKKRDAIEHEINELFSE
ncbi:MAG: STAS-like domain-containing protein [Cyclobacteriaceae bacterium]|nr:STAS-like domain-containing protein [Cyclobacteriaceae bacterium]